MRVKLLVSLFLAIACAVAVGSGAWAEEEKHWKSDDGLVMLLHDRTGSFHENHEVFDLADLRDGESRQFGEGIKQIKVTREGDAVTIFRPAGGDQSELLIRCDTSRDACQVLTDRDDPGDVMVIVKRTRECVNGEGDCVDVEIDVDRLPHGAHAFVKTVTCSPGEECEEMEDTIHGEHAGMGNVMIFQSGASDGRLLLRCPEGDATLRVEEAREKDVFLCPVHSTAMAPVRERHSGAVVREFRFKEKP